MLYESLWVILMVKCFMMLMMRTAVIIAITAVVCAGLWIASDIAWIAIVGMKLSAGLLGEVL